VNLDVIDTLRPILRRAARAWGAKRLPDIDWAELRLPEPKPKPKEFTVAELDDLLAALPARWRDFVGFAATYGCRLEEMFFPLSALDLADPTAARVTLRERKNDPSRNAAGSLPAVAIRRRSHSLSSHEAQNFVASPAQLKCYIAPAHPGRFLPMTAAPPGAAFFWVFAARPHHDGEPTWGALQDADVELGRRVPLRHGLARDDVTLPTGARTSSPAEWL
jgi:hypothetical protein